MYNLTKKAYLEHLKHRIASLVKPLTDDQLVHFRCINEFYEMLNENSSIECNNIMVCLINSYSNDFSNNKLIYKQNLELESLKNKLETLKALTNKVNKSLNNYIN